MKRLTIAVFLLAVFLVGTTCSSPEKSIEEEKALAALADIQSNLETTIGYEDFIALLDRAKIEIDLLKRNGKNNPCFMSAVDKCYSYYLTGGKAWKQKLETTDEARKNDMDLTMSVLYSQAALSIQMANNCYEN